MLLLESGLGKTAMKRSLQRGLFIGLFVGVSYFIAKSVNAGTPVLPAAFGLSQAATNDLFKWLWEGVLLVFYAVLWIAPNDEGFSSRRRPALVYYARFWANYRGATLAAEVLEKLDVDVGYCGYHLAQFVGFGVLKMWVSYKAFVMEAQFWHGISVTPDIKCCSSAVQRFKESVAKRFSEVVGFQPSLLRPTNELEAELLTSDDNRGDELAASITSLNRPFEFLPLTSESALRMSEVVDNIRNLSDTVTKTKTAKGRVRVPLIDFSRLKLLDPSRMLGAGSSARVYKGRWCGKLVAVKILFTVEISPEEIERTSLEASLLQSLQSTSEHIVRQHGIAVLPPSLCIILELCSEGSLFEILEKDTNSDLTWADKLELAIGASRGIEALVKTLPGFSHNDVKSANFLVHKNREPSRCDEFTYIVKLADFEFVTNGVTPDHMLLGEDHFKPNWTAPEVLDGSRQVSPASDIYSLANVLFEIATHQVPFQQESDPRAVARHIKEGRRPAFPETWAASSAQQTFEFRELVKQAWAQSPLARPPASALAQDLNFMLISHHRDSRVAFGCEN